MGVAEVTFPTVWERRLAYATQYKIHGTVLPDIDIGTSKEKIEINGACLTTFAGVAGTTLTAEDKDILSGTALAASQACRFLICAQSDGTVTATQGPILTLAEITSGETAAEMKTRSVLPAIPTGEVPLGDVYIVTTTGETFTFGTTELDANGTNATYRDFTWPDSGPDGFNLTGAQDG